MPFTPFKNLKSSGHELMAGYAIPVLAKHALMEGCQNAADTYWASLPRKVGAWWLS